MGGLAPDADLNLQRFKLTEGGLLPSSLCLNSSHFSDPAALGPTRRPARGSQAHAGSSELQAGQEWAPAAGLRVPGGSAPASRACASSPLLCAACVEGSHIFER